MARINLNEFGGQAGGVAYRVNQVRTDPVVVEAAKVALNDVRDASRSCSVLVREASASWQRTRPVASQSSAYHTGRTVTPPQTTPQTTPPQHDTPPQQGAQTTHDQQDRPAYRAAS